MKNKLLLFLLFHLLIGNKLTARNFENNGNSNKLDFKLSTILFYSDTIKKNKKTSRISRSSAVLLSPTVVAGSSCGDGVSFVQVNLYANGADVSDVMEWFVSQTAVTPVFTGTNFSPSISTTRTYYVQSKSADGLSVSIRVPVVASVYRTPPPVTLTSSPENNALTPLCFGTSVTFTASGGADLFEFSVDGVVRQAMSTNKVFVTNTLTDGQVVRVRSRYAVTLDGSTTEAAWGFGSMEDNILSAPLSGNASNGYINSLKISPTEDKLIFGITGKLINYRRVLLFLDTKPGGFNVSNYGDENGSLPPVRAFNYFNNNPSTFDSYFAADYCIAIATDAGETNYYADVIELKTGNSIKTYLGSAATGFPTSVMGVNKNNTGIADYNLGFEVEVLKSLIGYTTGDIKFFAFTMQDNAEINYNVTNSFLSPERTSNLDYGSAAVDYNLRDPNPVIVSSLALTPCYSESNIVYNIASNPSIASVGVNQFNCILTSDPLGGNTPTVGSGTWSLKSGPGTVVFSDVTSGSSMATVSIEGIYVFTWTISSGTCVSSSADVNVEYSVTPPPTISSIIQPTCIVNTGSVLFSGLPLTGNWTITPSIGAAVTGTGGSYQWDNLVAGTNYTFTVTADNTCESVPSSQVAINAVPLAPSVPTTAIVVQPTCGLPSGSISITAQSGVEYSLDGTTYQATNSFSGLAANTYVLYVRNLGDATCVTASATGIIINTVPLAPSVPTTAIVVQPTCGLPSGSISITAQSGVEYSLDGTTYQSSPVFSNLSPAVYTLYVRSVVDNSCMSISLTTIAINLVPTPPTEPVLASIQQPTCEVPSGTISITVQSGVEYSLDGINYQTSAIFTQLTPKTYILYVRNSSDNTCTSQSVLGYMIDMLPILPSIPMATLVTQPRCDVPSGTIVISQQTDVQYSVGNGFQDGNIFNDLAPGQYTISVRFKNSVACVSIGSVQTINPIPPQIQFETIGDCENKIYTLTANPINNSYNPNNVSYQWKDKDGSPVGTNSNVLNVSDLISFSIADVTFPLEYSLTIVSTDTGCNTSGDAIVESIYCDIQKGISPDGNGSNDFFDLKLMDVKKLGIFNRYGNKVYEQSNYTDQWKGQTDDGQELPSATYYYVIEFNNGKSKTGWIYLIREK